MTEPTNNIQKEANFHFYLNTQGPRGQRGPKGDDGFSPAVVVAENTPNTYKLKITTADGEFVTDNLRGSIITTGEGSYIKYDAATDKLYVGDIDAASPEIYGIVRTATEEDLKNLSESAVMTVSDVADFLSTHLQAADSSIDLSYDEDTGIITVKANVSYPALTDKPKLYGTEINGDKKLSEYVEIISPLVEVTGTDYEKDIVIENGTITNDNLVFENDWYPQFSGTGSLDFTLQGAYTLNGNEFTPDCYASMPFALGDILGFPANTGADIALGHQDDNGQFIFTHLLRVDGLVSGGDYTRTAFHVASKQNTGTTLNCTGTSNDSNTAITGANFTKGMCYFQVVLNEQGNMEIRFIRNETGTNAGTYGVVSVSSNSAAILDTQKLTRLYFGGTDILSNPLNQFAIYRQPNIDLSTVTSESAFDGLNNQINWAFPGDTTSLRVAYDNNTVTVNDKGELCTTENVAKKSDLNAIDTELDSLDARVEALEDEPGYSLPIASETVLGGIKIGENLSISEDGVLSAKGGQGGTSDYTELENLPSINGIELRGDKSADALSLEPEFEVTSPLSKTSTTTSQVKGYSINPDTGAITGCPAFSAPTWGTAYQYNIANWINANTSLIDEKKLDFLYYLDYPFKDGLYLAKPSDYTGVIFGTKENNGLFIPRVAMGTRSGNHVVALINGPINAGSTTWKVKEISSTTGGTASNATDKCFGLTHDDDGSIFIKSTPVNTDSAALSMWKSDALTAQLQECNTIRFLPAKSASAGISGSAIYPIGLVDNPTYAGAWPTSSERGNFKMVFPEAATVIRELSLNIDDETIKVNSDGKLYAVQQSSTANDTYGIKGDYSTHYGILDCPNGLIDFNINNKQITINAGMVLKCAGAGTMKTTIASAINHTITSDAGTITLFYANGNILECGKVDYSTVQPEDNGVNNYQAWFNPSLEENPSQQWMFKSNDTGNIWQAVDRATPIADVVVGDTGITSVSYIGYRVLDDDIIAQLSDIENLQDTVETLQTGVGDLQTTVAEHTTQLGGITLKRMTQAQYDALATKDENTLYVIIDQKAFVTAAEAAHAATLSSVRSEQTNLEIGASGTIYTAPVDGSLYFRATLSNGYLRPYNQTRGDGDFKRIYSTDQIAEGIVSANKGDSLHIQYAGLQTTGQYNLLVYIPLNGALEE